MARVSVLVVDTSSWISYFRGAGSSLGSSLIDVALEEARVSLPPIVAAELLSGKLAPRKRAKLEELLGDIGLFDCDLSHWFRVGRLRADLAARGLSISTPDAHVAQCALDLDAELLTEDDVFAGIARHHPLHLCG